MAEDRLGWAVQESLLTAIGYIGAEAAPLLAVLTPDLFDGEIYQCIAERVIDYRNQFREPPAEAHLDDLFSDILDDREHKHYRAFTRVLVGMREQSSASTFNVKYLVEQVGKFARGQRIKEGLIKANERFMAGGEGRDDEVEQILDQTRRFQLETTTFGEKLSNSPLSFLRTDDTDKRDKVLTGIRTLDRLGIVPTRKELFYIMGKKKAGKSWALQYLGRRAIRQGWIVAHVSLENRTDLVKQRYVQGWFSAAKRNEPYIRPEFVLGKRGLEDIDYEIMNPSFALDNPKDVREIERLIPRWSRDFERMIIQEWASNTLTISGFEHWLDGLEATQGVVPDLILMDMPQLMKLDHSNPSAYRLSFGRVTVELRRIAGERNMAIAGALHTNRQGETAKVIRRDHAAEDISQAGTVDTLLTYNRTEAERRLGLARLHVDASRGDKDGFSILISQSYDVGQFHLDSVPMRGSEYWDMLKEVDEAAIRENVGGDRGTEYYDDDPTPAEAEDE